MEYRPQTNKRKNSAFDQGETAATGASYSSYVKCKHEHLSWHYTMAIKLWGRVHWRKFLTTSTVNQCVFSTFDIDQRSNPYETGQLQHSRIEQKYILNKKFVSSLICILYPACFSVHSPQIIDVLRKLKGEALFISDGCMTAPCQFHPIGGDMTLFSANVLQILTARLPLKFAFKLQAHTIFDASLCNCRTKGRCGFWQEPSKAIINVIDCWTINLFTIVSICLAGCAMVTLKLLILTFNLKYLQIFGARENDKCADQVLCSIYWKWTSMPHSLLQMMQ